MRWMLVATSAILLAATARAADYRVGAGDTVEVRVYGYPELSGAMLVGQDCRLDLHFVSVPICDRSTREIASAVKAALEDGYLHEADVMVNVKEYGSQTVEVRGAVVRPGMQVMRGPTTLSEAITQAGGPKSASVLDVVVLRGSEKLAFHVPDLGSGTPIFLHADDVIHLAEPMSVFVEGEVNKVGAVPYTSGLMVTEALALAGGPSSFAGLGRCYVLRSNGEKERVNVRRISRGLEADVELKPDDRVHVRRSLF